MTDGSRKIRFGLWYDFRNPPQWRQPSDRLYREILDQIAWGENNGFDDVWLSEHHFIEDGYLPSILPAAAAIAARTNRIRIASGVLLITTQSVLPRILRPLTSSPAAVSNSVSA
jgi:alkanesulfonate monooxygenase SsuD/methylene tetrahydromethanopterin reductase-like flavin-dependent oxidoreductase (luciferase family)